MIQNQNEQFVLSGAQAPTILGSLGFETPKNHANETLSGGITTQIDSSDHQSTPPIPVSIKVSAIEPPLIAASDLQAYGDMIKNVWPCINPVVRDIFPEFARVYEQIKNCCVPNFLGARIEVKSGLILSAWHENLLGYHDAEIFHYLRYGWPLGYNMKTPPQSVDKNHQSAVNFEQHIREFIKTELEFKALTGPFDSRPFLPWTRVSPMMTRIKKDSPLRRVIVDLSFPVGQSVNSGINTASVLGKDITYTLPTILDLVNRLKLVGPGAYVWKADLARAYRQLRTDPIDAPLLAVNFDGKLYVDNCPPFGCRSSSAVCQRTANAIVYMLAKRGFHCIAYLDDFSGCEVRYDHALQAFNVFNKLAMELGLQLSKKKCIPPCTEIDWLGYNINTCAMTIAIPTQKLLDINNECTRWYVGRKVNKTMVQSILGKLIFAANCVTHARKFVSRILNTLRGMTDGSWVTVGEQFMKDIQWFQAFAQLHNGVNIYDPPRQEEYIDCDSSLQGGGGNTKGHYYIWRYTPEHKKRFKNIHHLEAINVLIAVRTLAPTLTGKNVRIVVSTDNMASSFALMTGRTSDMTLASCARELWLEATVNHYDIAIRHKLGVDIPLADALSRYHNQPSKRELADSIIVAAKLARLPPALSNMKIFTDCL